MKQTRFWNLRYPVAAVLVALSFLAGVTMFLPRENTATALVVKSPICAGCTITAASLSKREVIDSNLPGDRLLDSSAAVGQTATVDLSPGTVLQPSFILNRGVSKLRPGEVAFALELNNPAITGFSQPGQTVEIWSGTPQETEQLLATDVRVVGVVAADNSLLGTSHEAATVYLAASEESARRVIAAKSEHELSFVLRAM